MSTRSWHCLTPLEGTATHPLLLLSLSCDANDFLLTSLLPTRANSLSHVTELLLFDNLLERIPPSLFDMSSLEMLNLDKNHIIELPSTVGPLSVASRAHLPACCPSLPPGWQVSLSACALFERQRLDRASRWDRTARGAHCTGRCW